MTSPKTFATDAERRTSKPTAKPLVAKIRENIKIARHAQMEVTGNGLIAAYIHTGAKVGVLVEVGAGKAETVAKDEFKQLVKDITLQIAAGHPHAVSREQVPAEVIAKEREIAAQSDRLKGKPAQAMEKILAGVLDKFFQTYCLVDQGFVKRNSEISVKEHVGAGRQAARRRNHHPPVRPLPGGRKRVAGFFSKIAKASGRTPFLRSAAETDNSPQFQQRANTNGQTRSRRDERICHPCQGFCACI